MTLEVIAASVGDTYTFNPAVASFNFCIPTIHGVMRHLILFMLAETKALGVNTDIGQEIPRDAHEFRNG